ncbi:hypothetical protein L226DRAFT_563559 [Lentinus tigrinus ALCF2SS1-7]|uniref:Uncharacterized protein n=1 Tax=Lentinus tigrinus ALCF2SS1-6 TaxID=1328759 RepID=A0A5C2RXA9_9APHY|nr:hypothetical protein L227DRAFT_579432 [Lentinus tigrinus ALCF2SS1-6]RPD69088.1 hypothetical protein L226DRAFT_563559 [Lentinus tigrinus ALCF2SS1-7]
MLPAQVLPRPLNPVYIECDDVRDIPTAWYGIPWNKQALIKYAAKRGWAVPFTKSDNPAYVVPGSYDIVLTWPRLTRHYYAKHGIAMRLRDVWDEPRIGKVITFYNNREMPNLTKKQRYTVFDTLEEMGYKPGEALWYLDEMETL